MAGSLDGDSPLQRIHRGAGREGGYMDMQKVLEELEEAERIYETEPLFRQYADKRHTGHCDVSDPLACIEEDHFLARMLNAWDDDPIDG